MPAPDPELLADFLAESNELIEVLDRDLVELEKQPGSDELVNSAFRAMHTIKGAGSFLALDALTGVAHAAEDVLNLVRKQEVQMSAELMSGLLRAVDVLRGQLDELGAGGACSAGPPDLVATLQSFCGPPTPTPTPAPAPAPGNAPGGASAAGGSGGSGGSGGGDAASELPASKLDLLEFMVADLHGSLAQLGTHLAELRVTPSDAEAAAAFAVACAELGRSVDFFELSEMLAEVSVAAAAAEALPTLSPASQRQAVLRLGALHEVLGRRADRLAASRVLAFDALTLTERLAALGRGEELPADQHAPEDADAEETLRFDLGLPEPAGPAPAEPAPAAAAQAPDAKPEPEPIKQAPAETSIRVDVARLETLLNLVGELVLEKNRVLALSRQRDGGSATFHEQLDQVASDLDRVTSELQLSVMKTRMQPMNKLFSRYPRVIRDLASATGKDIHLEIRGGETEVDKSVIELLADPMVHLLRNCADHGLEDAAGREAAGKPARGEVVVEASHEGSHVVISIQDDGRGIDPDAVAAKAIERGMITREEADAMSRQDLTRLVFAPGFSTAAEVTGLSGRGVGMDVVHSNIVKLNGLIDLDSEPGRGTTVRFRIPLTLAIMQAMMTEAADAVYAIPLANVIEIVEPEEGELPTVRGVDVLRLRDEVIPLIDLREVLGGEPDAGPGTHVIVVGSGERRMGLRADGLVGQQEIVIKPLDPLFEGNRLVSGATVREDGGVSLILDVGTIVESNHGRARGVAAATAQKQGSPR